MADPKNNAASDDDATESRMRLALGLRGAAGPPVQQRADQARARHKFVQDGGVPVVVLNSRGEQDVHKARVAELEGQLATERAQHAATRRALGEAQATAQGLQTHLAHAELAHRDALHAAQQAPEAALEQARAAMPVARKVVRKSPIGRLPRDKEPKPVKWWTPTYRAKTKVK